MALYILKSIKRSQDYSMISSNLKESVPPFFHSNRMDAHQCNVKKHRPINIEAIIEGNNQCDKVLIKVKG